MRVVVKRVDTLSVDEYNACYSLNLRSNGMMREELVRCRRNNLGWAFMVFDRGKLMSWALMFNRILSNNKGAYFYTRVNARGKGYASKISEAIVDFNVKVTVYPWNNSSDRFFSKRTFDKSYAFWKYGELRHAS